MNILTTYSSANTKALGEKLAKRISNLQLIRRDIRPSDSPTSKTGRAFVIALSGDLGAGKTTFIQGFVGALGIKKRVTSPTFILFRRFAIRHSPFTSLYHVDAYRIKSPKEIAALEFKEILSNPANIVLIEWPENIKKILPKNILRIQFAHGQKENERQIVFK